MRTFWSRAARSRSLRTFGPAILTLILALALPRLTDAQLDDSFEPGCSERDAILARCYETADGYWERLQCDVAAWLYLPDCWPAQSPAIPD
jgi:hypothetical protein